MEAGYLWKSLNKIGRYTSDCINESDEFRETLLKRVILSQAKSTLLEGAETTGEV